MSGLFAMVNIVNDIKSFFFPSNCLGCQSQTSPGEDLICVYCRHHLPVTHFSTQRGNPLEELFLGRVELEKATALFWYQEAGLSQQLIHHLKYRDQPRLGKTLGSWLGEEMKQSGHFDDLDLIIPIPLLKSRFRERGYNQSAAISRGLSLSLGIPIEENALARKGTYSSQTSKTRIQRDLVLHSPFSIGKVKLRKNMHVLLVDDVVTTGATMEACIRVLQQHFQSKVSVASLAITA